MAEAADVFQGLRKDYPKDPALPRSLGEAWAKAGDFGRAAAAFSEALAMGPHPDLYYRLGVCYREKGDAAAAIDSFEKFLAAPGQESADKIQSARASLARLKASGR
jgi:tetratricopeptide (TPR) repeat protein